ncbi:helix-turn-helix domain-containing protein [Nocardioides sp. NPDC057772]|uniref:helix-turn-helix domain-containing protein n=1 Tax=Nocardioides sp. NPDC057772 TaxID=3346245 RepID=UPI00366E711C
MPLTAISAAFDRERLRQARTLAGLKKNEVAERVGVSAAAIGQYESGAAKPRPEHLPTLARTLDVDVTFFAAGRPLFGIDTGHVHFRSLRSMRASDRELALTTVEQIRELVHVFERHVEFPAVDLPEVPDSSTAPEAAALLRDHWNLGTRPVRHLVATMESNGVVVVVTSQNAIERVDAFSCELEGRPVVVSSPRWSMEVYKHRFTCAHELGHLLMHHDPKPGDVEQEKEADAFAAAFLTPAVEMNKELPERVDLDTLDRIGRKWGVSIESLLLRMRELRHVSEPTLRRAFQRLAMIKDVRPAEPLTAYPGEQPTLLLQALELSTEGSRGIADLAAELSWKPRRIRDLIGIESARPRLSVVRDPAVSEEVS